VQELLSSPSLLAAVNISSCLARKVVQISVGGFVFQEQESSQNTKLQENIQGQRKCTPLMSKTGKLVTMDEEKAEVLNNFFASLFTATSLFPHLSSGSTARWGLGEQNPSHCKRRSGL